MLVSELASINTGYLNNEKMKFNVKKILSNAKESAIIAGSGAVANFAVDAAVQGVEALAPITANPMYLNLAKVAAGSVLAAYGKSGGLVNYAGTGLATVGASNLAASLMEQYFPNAKPSSGVPFQGTGRIRMGQRGFRNMGGKGRGTQGLPFVGK